MFSSRLALLLLLPLVQAARVANTTFTNPILPGFHPDPSCVYVKEWDNTLFCATSSFNVFPGVPIHASKDLQNFNLLSNVINRPEQVPGLAHANGSTSGIWAPTLRYHNKRFYVFTTLVYDKLLKNDTSRWDNMYFWTDDPYKVGSWSDPIHFTFEGYDTSPWWHEDGTLYIVGAHPWEVEPAINMISIDFKTGKTTSNVTTIWTGTGGQAPEGPHFYFKNGYYYLMIAEGGTGLLHMQTMARSKNIMGPYEANPANPLLSNANTTEYFQTVGHAELFQDDKKNWWAVALSTRSGPEYVTYPMGRETVLTPAKWTGDWPTIEPVRGVMEGPLPKPNLTIGGAGPRVDASDHLTFSKNFSLPQQLVYYRLPEASSYTISPPEHPNTLKLVPSFYNLTGIDAVIPASPSQSFLGRRQVHTLFDFSVDILYTPVAEEEEAGVSVMLVQAHHIDFGIVSLPTTNTTNATSDSGLSPYLRLRTTSLSTPAREDVLYPLPVNATLSPQTWTLQITTPNATHYAFSFGPAGHQSQLQTVGLGLGLDVSYGFTGTLLGVYATANGGNGTTPAYFSNWKYTGLDQYVD